MKRILITGAAGFVGANLAARSLADGCDVYAAVRPGTDRWRLDAIGGDVRVLEADLRSAESVARVVAAARPEWIFHTAVYGAYSWQTDAERILETNVAGTATLLEACAAAGFEAFVNAGTSSEYGRKDHAPAETEPGSPLTRYAMAKLSATEYCRSVARSRRLPVITLRLYSVYGPFEDPGRLLPRVIVAGMSGRLPPLARPAAAHDFVHVDDVCEAFVRVAAGAGREPDAIYNVGTGVQTTLAEIVDLARAVFGLRVEPAWESMPARAWDTHTWVANSALIAERHGWRARTPFGDGVRRFVDWFRRNPAMLARYRARQAAA